MDDDATVGSDDVVNEESTFANAEHKQLDPRPEREHSEDSSMDIQNAPSTVSDFLPRPGGVAIAACELSCDALKSDFHSDEHDAGKVESQNHLSESALVGVVVQEESADECSSGKRILESTESCYPASKRLKTSHDLEVSDPDQPGLCLTGEGVVKNPNVSVNFAKVKSVDEAVEVVCSVEDPCSSVIVVVPSSRDIQKDDSHKSQEPSSADGLEGNPECGRRVEAIVSEELLSQPIQGCVECIENPNVSDISSAIKASNEEKEMVTSEGQLSPECVESMPCIENPTFTDIGSVNPTSIEQKEIATTSEAVRLIQPEQKCVEVVSCTENTNVTDISSFQASNEPKEISRWEGALCQPKKCVESAQCIEICKDLYNIPSSQLSVNPAVDASISLQTDDQLTENISASVSHAGNLPQPEKQLPMFSVIFPESGTIIDESGSSRSGVAGADKCLSPFEISMVIDNLIRRELETSVSSSHDSEDASDDGDLGDEESLSAEKMDVGDEEYSDDSKSSLKEKGESSVDNESESPLKAKESSVENETDDQNQMSLSPRKDDATSSGTDCKTSESVARMATGVLNPHQTVPVVDSDETKVSNETCENTKESFTRLDVEQCHLLPTGLQGTDEATPVKEGDLVDSGMSESNTDLVSNVATSIKEGDKVAAVVSGSKADTVSNEAISGKESNLVGSVVSENRTDLVSSKSTPVKESDLVLFVEPESRAESVLNEKTPGKEGDLVGSIESVSTTDTKSEVKPASTPQERSIEEEDLPASTDDEAKHYGAQQLGAETAPRLTEAAVTTVSASTAEKVTKKLYDPFEDMEIVDEDAATDEDGLADNRRISDERGTRRERGGAGGRGDRHRGKEDSQRHDRFGPDVQDQNQWSRDGQWVANEQGQWPANEQGSWYGCNNDGEMYPSRLPPPPASPGMNNRPSNYDPGSSGNTSSYEATPPSTHASQPGPMPAQGCVPPSYYMPPPPGMMQPPGGYGASTPYGGMPMPAYYGQWGQWPGAAPAYPTAQQQQTQEWYNWWQSYSAWYSSYMSGWYQPGGQPTDPSQYQSWQTANQQLAPPPPVSEAPPPPPTAKESTKSIFAAAKNYAALLNSKISYRPTVTKGPLLTSTPSVLAPFSAPKLKFSISGPATAAPKPAPPTAAPKPTPPTKPPESRFSAGKDAATAGAKTDQNKGHDIWVGNLPLGTSAVDVRTLISKYGKVVKCKVGSIKSQRDAGLSALVTMETANDVAVCIQTLHEAYYNGQKILVRKLKQQ